MAGYSDTYSDTYSGDVPLGTASGAVLWTGVALGGTSRPLVVLPPITPADLSAVVGTSHRYIVQADLYDGDRLVGTLAVTDGSVSVDGAADVRRRCSVTAVDTDSALTGLAEELVIGCELLLWRGAMFDRRPQGGTIERYLYPLGVFVVTDAEISDEGTGVTVALSGMDRAQRLIDADFTVTTTVAAGTNYRTAIVGLAQAVMPDVQLNLPATTAASPGLVYKPGDGRWTKLRAMASSCGWNLFFDVQGILTAVPVPDPATAPITATYTEGAGARVLSAKRKFSRQGVYNHVVVTGENADTDPPVWAEAVDDDPRSPTYIGSPRGASRFGDVLYRASSQYVTTTQQAQDYASAQLLKVKGVPETLELSTLVDVTLDADQVIAVDRAALGLFGVRYVIDTMTIPLQAGQAMTASTRRSA